MSLLLAFPGFRIPGKKYPAFLTADDDQARRAGADSEFERAARRRANRALPATAPPELAGAKPRFSLFSFNSSRLTRSAVRRYISPSEKKGKNTRYMKTCAKESVRARTPLRCPTARQGGKTMKHFAMAMVAFAFYSTASQAAVSSLTVTSATLSKAPAQLP